MSLPNPRVLLPLLTLLLTPPAWAVPLFVDFGAGISKASQTAPVFSPSGGAWENGLGGVLTAGVYLQEKQGLILFSAGIQQRYMSGLIAGQNTQILPTYALLRLEVWRLMLGAGYSPWIWKDPLLSKNRGASARLVEATLLFPITLEIDFGVQLAAQTFQTQSGAQGPDPSYDALALFRLNFGISESEKTTRRKFKGWRYPFGNPSF